MDARGRRLVQAVSLVAAVLVTGTAIWTGNPGLYLLAGLSIAGALGLWVSSRRG